MRDSFFVASPLGKFQRQSCKYYTFSVTSFRKKPRPAVIPESFLQNTFIIQYQTGEHVECMTTNLQAISSLLLEIYSQDILYQIEIQGSCKGKPGAMPRS
jgi:hypothetical protein